MCLTRDARRNRDDVDYRAGTCRRGDRHTGGFGTLVGPGGDAQSVAVAADGYLLGGGYSVSMAPVVYLARFGR